MTGFKEFVRWGLYDAYASHLKGVCDKNPRLSLIEIGKAGGLPIFSVRIDNKKKHTIVVCAGVHGDEVACPWAVAKYLEDADPTDYNYVFIPVGNPTGFDAGRRRNHLNRDLNRHFRDKELTGENKLIYDAVKKENIALLYSMHEHPKAKGFYIYSSRIDPGLSRTIVKKGERLGFKIRTNHFGKPIPDGEVRLNRLDGDNSFEDRMYKEGVPYVTIETPGTAPLHKRIKAQYELLKFVLDNYELR